MFQGGKGMFIGGFSDFLEHCQVGIHYTLLKDPPHMFYIKEKHSKIPEHTNMQDVSSFSVKFLFSLRNRFYYTYMLNNNYY